VSATGLSVLRWRECGEAGRASGSSAALCGLRPVVLDESHAIPDEETSRVSERVKDDGIAVVDEMLARASSRRTAPTRSAEPSRRGSTGSAEPPRRTAIACVCPTISRRYQLYCSASPRSVIFSSEADLDIDNIVDCRRRHITLHHITPSGRPPAPGGTLPLRNRRSRPRAAARCATFGTALRAYRAAQESPPARSPSRRRPARRSGPFGLRRSPSPTRSSPCRRRCVRPFARAFLTSPRVFADLRPKISHG
jgi:hypothetical protein